MGWQTADGWSKKQDGRRSALGGKAARMGELWSRAYLFL